jgi:hypothetical protein
MFQVFQTYVASHQVFHLDVIKVDLDVAYVAIAMFQVFQVFETCCKCILQIFQLFRTYVANVSSRCCKSRSGIAHVPLSVITPAALADWQMATDEPVTVATASNTMAWRRPPA